MPALVVVDGQHPDPVVQAATYRPVLLYSPIAGTMTVPSFADSGAGVLDHRVRGLARDPGTTRALVVLPLLRPVLLEPISGPRGFPDVPPGDPEGDRGGTVGSAETAVGGPTPVQVDSAAIEPGAGVDSSVDPLPEPRYPSTRRARDTGSGSGGEI